MRDSDADARGLGDAVGGDRVGAVPLEHERHRVEDHIHGLSRPGKAAAACVGSGLWVLFLICGT